MKYKQKYHELDQESNIWTNANSYYLWGAAGKGTTFVQRYKDKITIKGIIDKDSEKWGKNILAVPIISPQILPVDGAKIIVCTEAYREVANYLRKSGLCENIDYIDYKRFATIFDWYVEGKVYINRVDVSVTNRCTLNCKDCNMLMPYYSEPKDRELDEIKQDLDALFRWVDTVEDLNLLGGEPLLYPQLIEVLRYIQANYRNKVVDIYIFTNGMCRLSDDLLQIAREMDVIFDVSDYTITLPQIALRLESFHEKLKNNHIRSTNKKMDYWLDFGFETADHSKEPEEEKIAFFHRCGASFRGLRNRKLYYCHIEASALELGEWVEQDDDAFSLEPYNAEKKIALLEFNLGYSDRGYPSICMRCEGCCSSTKIGVAVQRKKDAR